MAGMGHEDLFTPPRLSAGYRLRKPTLAGTQGNGQDAPIPAIRQLAARTVDPGKPPFPPARSAIDAVSSVLHPSPRRWVAFVLGFRAVVAAWRMECTVGASLPCLAAR